MNQLRREKIKQYILEQGAVTIKQINGLFPEVSLMTIRRDLEQLELEGFISRIRGGAIPGKRDLRTKEDKLESRMQTNLTAKKKMAKKAAALIGEGSAVFLDAGTSALALALEIADMDLNIFTTGPNIALALSKLYKPTIHLCGGTLNKANQALSGEATLRMLADINIATAFIGVSGYTLETGFTCGKEEEMMVKRLVMEKARVKVMLMDSSKIGKILPYMFGHIADADYLVGDGELFQEVVQFAKEKGVVVL